MNVAEFILMLAGACFGVGIMCAAIAWCAFKYLGENE